MMMQAETGNSKAITIAAWFIIIGAIVAVLMFFSSFIQPLVLAVILWFMIIELRSAFAKISIRGRSLPKPILTIISTVTVLYLFYLISNIIFANIQNLARNMSLYTSNLVALLESVEKLVNVENLGERVQQDRSMLIRGAAGIAAEFAALVGNSVLILLYVIFMLVEESTFGKKLKMMVVGSDASSSWKQLSERMYKLFHDYATIKILTSLSTGLLSYAVFLIVGVDLPAVWAFIIFLLNFIPSIGSIVATLLVTGFTLVQYGIDVKVIEVFGGILIIQVLVGNILEPRIMGSRLNLSPLIVIISLTFWGFIWGVIGMLLSVPITAMLMIIFSQFEETRNIAILCSSDGEIASLVEEEDRGVNK